MAAVSVCCPEISVEDLLRRVRLLPEAEVQLRAGISGMWRKECRRTEKAAGETVVGITDL